MSDERKEALEALQRILKLSEQDADDLLFKLATYFSFQFDHQNDD
jgi:hypothetical protein